MAKNPRQQGARDAALGIGGDRKDWNSITEDTDVGIDDVLNQVTVPAANSITATLPPVGSAPGRRYLFVCIADGAGDGVAVEDRDDAFVDALRYAAAGNGMTAKGDYLIVEDCGLFYRQVAASLT